MNVHLALVIHWQIMTEDHYFVKVFIIPRKRETRIEISIQLTFSSVQPMENVMI